MTTQFLTIRLNAVEARLIARLNEKTGLTKTQIVKQALKNLSIPPEHPSGGGLFEIGADRFGRYGDKARQSADIKQVVRARLDAKRTR